MLLTFLNIHINSKYHFVNTKNQNFIQYNRNTKEFYISLVELIYKVLNRSEFEEPIAD